MNRSETSRGSIEKTDWMARSASLRASALRMLARFHVSKVWLSHSVARAARHGASSGTVLAIWSSWPIAFWASTSATGLTGGIVPLYSSRRPLKKSTFRPVL